MIEPRILIGRAPPINPHPYDVVAQWIQEKYPDIAPRFHLCTFPFRLRESAPYKLFVQWVQDPIDVVNPMTFLQAMELQYDCNSQEIPIVNGVDRHRNTAKIQAHQRLSGAGIRTPRIHTFRNPKEFMQALPNLTYPLILREDVSHGKQFCLLNNEDDLRQAPFGNFYRPVLSEFIDVQSDDGRYRKYRSVVAGGRVISHHVQVSDSWETRGKQRIKDAATREEEIAYISNPDPFAKEMLEVAKALELEFAGIDYAIDRKGDLVVWEANQYPHLHFSTKDLIYRNFAMERTIAAMVLSYLELAGVEPPEKLVHQAGYDVSVN
ncbi:MAG: hypothetical protein H7Y17_13620 [Chlorobia bacterium]|nr:hypothetical protein [Fimbriimonadaceae bacterium]